MRAEDLLVYLRKQPFEPFRIVLSDGTTYEIRHPEMVLPSRRTIVIGIPSKGGPLIAEQIVTAALVHIVRLEQLDTAAAG
ncbi:MAG: hypothetical protein JNM56_27955 [Planctomycetia bacterium]|nr:hypothetical protein [Planctomycetia bacterium]